MLNFLINNWKDILEIIISLILGFFGGKKYENFIVINNKQTTRIKGNNNNFEQKGKIYKER